MANYTIRDSNLQGPFFWAVFRNNNIINFRKYYEEDGKLKTYKWYGSAKDKADDLGGKWEVRLLKVYEEDRYLEDSRLTSNNIPAITWDEFRAYPLSWRAKNLIGVMHEHGYCWDNYHYLLQWAFNNFSYATIQYPIDKSSKDNYISSLENLWQGIYNDEAENVNAGFPTSNDDNDLPDNNLTSNIFTIKNLIIVGVVFLIIIFLIYLYA